MKLAVVGGGAMGEAIIAAVLRAQVLDAASISVAERYQDRLDYLAKTYSIRAAAGPASSSMNRLMIKGLSLACCQGITLTTLTFIIRYSSVTPKIDRNMLRGIFFVG